METIEDGREGEADVICPDSMSVGVHPGQEAGPAGAAEGSRRERIGESNPLLEDPLLRARHEAHRLRPLIVADQYQEIRPRDRLCRTLASGSRQHGGRGDQEAHDPPPPPRAFPHGFPSRLLSGDNRRVREGGGAAAAFPAPLALPWLRAHSGEHGNATQIDLREVCLPQRHSPHLVPPVPEVRRPWIAR